MGANGSSQHTPLLGGKLLRDLVALAGSQFLSKVIGFVAFAYLARVLAPESYGSIEFAIGLVAIFTMIVECGLCPVGVRRLAQDPERMPELAAEIPAIRLLIALVLVPVLWFSISLFDLSPETKKVVRLFVLGLLFVPFYQKWLFQGLELMHLAAVAPVLRMGAFAALVMVLVEDTEDLLRVGVLDLVAGAIAAVYFLFVQRARVIPFRLSWSISAFKSLSKEGWLLGLSDMLLVLVQYLPLMLVASLIGGEETAWFGAPHRCGIAALAFSGLYFFNLYPSLARRFTSSMEEFLDLARASYRLVAWGGIFGGILVTLLADPLLVLAFGKKFSVAAPVFAILIWTLPIALISGHARWILTAAGMQGHVLQVHIAGLVAIAPLSFVLVFLFAAEGAAISAVATSFVMWIAGHYYLKSRITSDPKLVGILRPLVLAIAAYLIAQFTDFSPWIDAGITILIFGALAPVLDRRLLPAIGTVVHAKSDLDSKP